MITFRYPFTKISSFSSEKPFIPIVILNPVNGFDYQGYALIDTGADTSVIPEYIAKALYHDIRNPKVKRDFTSGIGGEIEVYLHTFSIKILSMNVKGKINFNKFIQTQKKLYPVVPGLLIPILGQDDFLKDYILTVDYPKLTFSIKSLT